MKKSKRTRRTFGTQEKIKAVLSIWTERRSPAEVCREMSVSWTLLDRWQNIAMEGMMTALEGKKKEARPALNERLSRLLEKKVCRQKGNLEKLEDRLKTIQEKKSA